MTIEQFCKMEKARFDRWYSTYLTMNKLFPNINPLDMNHDEWLEHYKSYNEEGPQ